MWKQLATVAIQEGRLLIAQRCFAGLNDLARVRLELIYYLNSTFRFIEHTIEMADELDGGMNNYKVRARCALLQRQIKEAERIYLENVKNSV